MVKKVTAAIMINLPTIWFKNPRARAAVMLVVRGTVTRKVVRQELQEIVNEMMEQAEAQYRAPA